MLPLVLATAAFVPAPRAPASALTGHRSPMLRRDAVAAVVPLHARRRDIYMEAYEMTHIEDETMYDDVIEQASQGNGAAPCQTDAVAEKRAHFASACLRAHAVAERAAACHALSMTSLPALRLAGLIVIKVFASWCRACKAMAPKLDRVAKEYPEIEFYDLMFDNNKKLCKKLGIKVLPYIEIVKGGEGKVEGFSCGPSKIGQLQQKLQQYSSS